MPTLRKESARKRLTERLLRLAPDARPLWGQMDAGRMISHLIDAMEMALGRLAVPSKNIKKFQRFPFKHLFLYVVPFPKNVRTARELLTTPAGDLNADRVRFLAMMDELARTPQADGPEHPFFGPLTMDEWNTLQAKHLDHHLRQFGL